MEVISGCSEAPSDEVSSVRTEAFYKYANLEDIPTFTSILGRKAGGSIIADENCNTQVQPTPTHGPAARTEIFYQYSCFEDIPSFEFRPREQAVVGNGHGLKQQNTEIFQFPTPESYVNDDGIQVQKLRSSIYMKYAMAFGYENVNVEDPVQGNANGEDLVYGNGNNGIDDGNGGGVVHCNDEEFVHDNNEEFVHGNNEEFVHGNNEEFLHGTNGEGFVHLHENEGGYEHWNGDDEGFANINGEEYLHFHHVSAGFVQQNEGGYVDVDENSEEVDYVGANNGYGCGNTSVSDPPRFDDRNPHRRDNVHQEFRRRGSGRGFAGASGQYYKNKRARNGQRMSTQDVRDDSRYQTAYEYESRPRGNVRPNVRSIEEPEPEPEPEPTPGWMGYQHGVLYANPQAYSDMANANNNIHMGNALQPEHLNGVPVPVPNHMMPMSEELHNNGSPNGHATLGVFNANDSGFGIPYDPRNNGCNVVPWHVIRHPFPISFSSNGLYYGLPPAVVPHAQVPIYVPNAPPMHVPQMFPVNQQELERSQ